MYNSSSLLNHFDVKLVRYNQPNFYVSINVSKASQVLSPFSRTSFHEGIKFLISPPNTSI